MSTDIAKHMKRGRQEDSHEFLRYAIDALQKSCLADQPPKLDAKVAETTWVHKVFGGKLRSRVTCHGCEHNSDTFDSLLDLSIDIHGQYSVRDALRNFVAVDYLKGADKYKCDKCKQKVVAEKRFTIHEAPVALTIHLKRFSPLGRKIGHPVRYDERLSLGPYMSKGQYGPTYSLYGIISHAGGGPNSGHYYAHVKSASGPWYEMNDESVTRLQGVPTNMKNAYILFYIRDKGQALEQAVASKALPSPNVPARIGVAASMKKRKILDSDDEEVMQGKEKAAKKAEEKEKRPFIGPVLPPSTPVRSPSTSPTVKDPQAESLKRKIQAAAKPTPARLSTALQSLSQYNEDDEDDEDDDLGEKVMETDDAPPSTPATENPGRSSPTIPPASSSVTSPTSSTIPAISFYGSGSANGKKRKSPEDDDDTAVATREYAHTPLPERTKGFGAYMNPYSRTSSSGAKHNKNRYGGLGRKKRIII
ncbi:hypothetical protein EWM64_g6832 [Hericium alpestre]|uniref:ubiquitinyl hydrolase 1 n=1 Tax=Hericium alpestre TaxID=135208 RepID=A0A4Y9ZSG4_9AGAM|nr:hypothetical protein EWM64_g6832 [Hericium alpestre]